MHDALPLFSLEKIKIIHEMQILQQIMLQLKTNNHILIKCHKNATFTWTLDPALFILLCACFIIALMIQTI